MASAPARHDFLFVQSTTEVGGAETVLLNLFAASAELRRRCLVATLGFGKGDLPARLRKIGADVFEYKVPRLRYAWKVVPTLADLRGLVRRSGVRAVVANGSHPQLVAGVLARLSGARSVFLVHELYPYPLRINDPRVIAAFLAPCDLMLGVSRATELAAARLRPKTPHHVVYNGTPVVAVDPSDAAAARQELGARAGDVLIGVFGRLQRSKGQDVLLRAVAELGERHAQVRVAIVGGSVFGLEPEYAEELKTMVGQLGLSGRVVFTGFRSDVPRLMAACDIICNPSRAPESFGMAIVEGMMQGRPVVAASGGGPDEIILSDLHGSLVPPNDVPALGAALTRLVDDPDLRRRVGEAAAVRARSEFSSDAMSAMLLRRLDELVGGCQTGQRSSTTWS